MQSFEGQSACREMCQWHLVTNEGVQKVGWEGLKAKVGDIAALRRKSKEMAKQDGEYCFSMDFPLEFCAFCVVSAVSHLGSGKLMM